jgi:hypothetical protein
MSNKYSKEFKYASIGLLLNIIQKVNLEDNIKYYKFFQKKLHINSDEFESFKEHEQMSQSDYINTISKELKHKNHEILQFLMTLNRCIIIDGCDLKSYQRFEKIRDSFLEKF